MAKLSRLTVTIVFTSIAFMDAFGGSKLELIENKFFVGGQIVPAGCFAQLMTQLNGDNIIASIFLTQPSLRGCMNANDPYPSGDEDKITVDIQQLEENLYGINVCEQVGGSLGSSCDRILIKFENQEYRIDGSKKTVLSIVKVGDWSG